MKFLQKLFGYTDEDLAELHRINCKKWEEVKVKEDNWKEKVDENSLEEYEMCQWYIDHKERRR